VAAIEDENQRPIFDELAQLAHPTLAIGQREVGGDLTQFRNPLARHDPIVRRFAKFEIGSGVEELQKEMPAPVPICFVQFFEYHIE
jgi:hypothetical protein